MISIDAMAYVQQLLASRQIKDYYLDIHKVVIAPSKTRVYTQAHRGYFYLLTHELPLGLEIYSENWVLQVDQSWGAKTITKIQEFSGQLSIHLPQAGLINEIEFIRAIERR